MALVAYGSSGSDSDSDYDNEPSVPTAPKNPSRITAPPAQRIDQSAANQCTTSLAFHLPSPKAAPMSATNTPIDEEDDEFLRKKTLTHAVERPPPPPKPLAKAPVKILLPALSSFAEHKHKERPMIGAELPTNKPTGLINLLPKPKLMQFGQKSTGGGKASTSLVPDSIARPKRPATGGAIKKTLHSKPQPLPGAATTTAPNDGGSDDDDNNDAGDFFSLNADDQLPEVSAAEIAAMVASQSARMGRAVRDMQHEELAVAAEIAAAAAASDAAAVAGHSASQSVGGAMDKQAIAALCGSRQATKRSRHAAAELDNIIDISGDQVLPDRDEWLRQQLTGSTEYQPRGLVDGDPGAGTKRKHQITYLAHQAKANEQELQAMWAANRNTRRQTQNKYGF